MMMMIGKIDFFVLRVCWCSLGYVLSSRPLHSL